MTNSLYDIEQAVHNFGLNHQKREIFLMPTAESEYIDYRSASQFIKNLSILESKNTSPITIHQISMGGSWEYGMAIYDAIALSECHITFVTHGIAASMGSIIPQAADRRISMPNCVWMLHEGSLDGGENSIRQFKSLHDYNNYTLKQMMDIYVGVMKEGVKFAGKTDRYIYRFLENKFKTKHDWYLSASEAVEYGLVDDVY